MEKLASLNREYIRWELLIILFQVVAFWPVGVWYLSRMFDGSDEPYGVVALLTAAILSLRNKAGQPDSTSLIIISALTVSYAFIGYKFPFLLQGALLVTALSFLLSRIYFYRTIHLGLAGLLLLSLPLIASLQFFLGFPLRVVTSEVVSHLLTFFGYSVYSVGTMLHWRGENISIDAPCAGIRMLWSGLFLHFSLCTLRDLSSRMTILGYSLSMVIIFLGNLTRTFFLFFTESGIVQASSWVHPAIGIICFVLVSLAIGAIHLLILQEKRCAPV